MGGAKLRAPVPQIWKEGYDICAKMLASMRFRATNAERHVRNAPEWCTEEAATKWRLGVIALDGIRIDQQD